MASVKKTPIEVAGIFGCTPEQAQQQIRKCAAKCLEYAHMARAAKNEKHLGRTSKQWDEESASYTASLK